MSEEISAFIDDELERPQSQRLAGRLVTDTDCRAIWRRYQVYGAAMRQELPSGLSADFADRVQQALANEPVQLVPVQRRRSPVLVPATGLAVAASLLLITVLLLRPLGDDPATTGTPVPLASAPTSTAGTLASSGSGVDSELIVANSRNENIRQRINRLLVEHNEYNPATDVTGMLPYSRFVSHSASTE
jgi:sigma-E factor negative regulatory protein RseA